MENKSYDYIRKINYYETDKMGITHHSNYIRFMEEARTAYMEEIGCGYTKFESEGIISPVLAVNCQYKNTTTFNDELRITVSAKEYTGVKIKFGYVMTNTATKTVVFVGESEHCFLDEKWRPVIVRKKYPDIDLLFKDITEKN